MRRVATRGLAAILLLATSGCGGGGEDDDPVVLEPNPEAGLMLSLTHTEPLRAGAPVTWTVQVRNARQEPVTLTFGSGQRADVVLVRGQAERYRWSKAKAFTQALAEVPVAPGRAESFELEDDALEAEPGQYEVVASLTSQPSPTDVRLPVTVSG